MFGDRFSVKPFGLFSRLRLKLAPAVAFRVSIARADIDHAPSPPSDALQRNEKEISTPALARQCTTKAICSTQLDYNTVELPPSPGKRSDRMNIKNPRIAGMPILLPCRTTKSGGATDFVSNCAWNSHNRLLDTALPKIPCDLP